MGTRFEVLLTGADTPGLRAAGEDVLRTINDWHARLSRFEPASELSRINREAPTRAVRVDPDIFSLLSLCRDGWHATGGSFDAAAGSGAGFDAVELDEREGAVRFLDPRVRLDMGGIAKGFVLDLAELGMREAGVASALVHGGTSSVVAIGAPPGREDWQIRIVGTSLSIRANLRDAALSVSSPRGRVDAAGGHILDPRTGLAAHTERTAAVASALSACGHAGAWCEVWSTAACVVGGTPAKLPVRFSSACETGADWDLRGGGHFANEVACGEHVSAAMEVGTC